VTFTVDTAAPTVTLDRLPSPAPNRSPAFSGTATDHTPVTIDIYRGSRAEGPVLASTTAEVASGEWRSRRLDAPLEWGEYTAVAEQQSSLGNPTGVSAPVTFVAQRIAPAVVTSAASEVGRTSAALYGSVDPAGGPIESCYFEFGPGASFGRRVECGFVAGLSEFPASATEAVPVFARIYGLAPATTYRFQLVARGEGGEGSGSVLSFTTLPPLSFPDAGPPHAGTTASHSSTPTAAEVAHLIAAHLLRRERAARVASLHRARLLRGRFTSPAAGTVEVKWFAEQRPVSGRRARQLLIGDGRVVLRRAGAAVITVHLTPAGLALLSQGRSVRVKSTCTFTPPKSRPGRSSTSFTLTR
jgi:hypothetical protein